eukprot:8331936-Alexandrium_andersonii.AAC.1
MSASLVGSEMCIRDRQQQQLDQASSNVREMAEPEPETAPRFPWDCLDPVSYTHLTLPTICSV